MKCYQVHAIAFAMASLTLLSCTGCGDKTGDVAGTVRYDGQEIPHGRIVFYCQGGDKLVLMGPISDGSYSIQDVPVGPAKITVETFEQKTTPVPGQFSKHGSMSSPIPQDQPPDGAAIGDSNRDYLAIPNRYRSVDRSNLDVEISRGQNVHDVDLLP